MKELGLLGDVREDLSIDQGGLWSTAWGRSWVLLHILSLCCHNYHYLSDFIDFVACAEGLVHMPHPLQRHAAGEGWVPHALRCRSRGPAAGTTAQSRSELVGGMLHPFVLPPSLLSRSSASRSRAGAAPCRRSGAEERTPAGRWRRKLLSKGRESGVFSSWKFRNLSILLQLYYCSAPGDTFRAHAFPIAPESSAHFQQLRAGADLSRPLCFLQHPSPFLPCYGGDADQGS